MNLLKQEGEHNLDSPSVINFNDLKFVRGGEQLCSRISKSRKHLRDLSFTMCETLEAPHVTPIKEF